MVARVLSLFFFAAGAIFLLLLAVLAGYSLTGNMYECGNGGGFCRDGLSALYIGLILLTAAVASFTIGAWIKGAG
ncbi:hypothetical protein KUV65_11140 [Maritalea mobilis]|uniref:Uncharacterized protein n=1 Tax=[Roseibacterium] beibuensis TaxID=1193142 RepID=A0ABP9LBB5_9RHOB|nr:MULTISPECIES: hypothetical protein [Alphaproteobacteria]MBY6201920.1 hypothetical protein [Maritalea mobilis]MCS6626652.1 hypothetical protein [Roseibacterium beibuensis]